MQQQYERHPLSAEYPDISGRPWETYVARVREYGIVSGRKIVIYEGKVLDGWQLYRACLEAGREPLFAELTLPDGMSVEMWVEIRNDNRRHESLDTMKTRAEGRRERAAKAKAEGDSIRGIAEREGVSPSQIQRDLAGVPGGTPDVEIKGKDGKTYPARPKKDRAKASPEAVGDAWEEDPNKAKAPVMDQLGKPVPVGLRDVFKNLILEETIKLVQQAATNIRNSAAWTPWLPWGVMTSTLEEMAEQLKVQLPHCMCPQCGGKGCDMCRSTGWMPRWRFNEL